MLPTLLFFLFTVVLACSLPFPGCVWIQKISSFMTKYFLKMKNIWLRIISLPGRIHGTSWCHTQCTELECQWSGMSSCARRWLSRTWSLSEPRFPGTWRSTSHPQDNWNKDFLIVRSVESRLVLPMMINELYLLVGTVVSIAVVDKNVKPVPLGAHVYQQSDGVTHVHWSSNSVSGETISWVWWWWLTDDDDDSFSPDLSSMKHSGGVRVKTTGSAVLVLQETIIFIIQLEQQYWRKQKDRVRRTKFCKCQMVTYNQSRFCFQFYFIELETQPW